jgi:hypothetical protein
VGNPSWLAEARCARRIRCRRTVDRILVVAAVAGLGLLGAGCGSSKAPSVASLGPTTSSGSTASGSGGGSTKSIQQSRAALAACLTSHGFPAAVGSGGGGSGATFFGVTIGGNVDPSSPQFQAAEQACRKFLPGGGPPALTPAQQAEHTKALASFAACMRRKGVVNFPDPDGQGRLPFGALSKLDQSAPLFPTAYKACQTLLPKFGPQFRIQLP